MNFTSLEYAFFLLIVFFLFYALPQRYQWKLLFFSSIVFYMISVPQYIFIPIFIGIVSFSAGILMEKARELQSKKVILIISLMANLGILAFFKYVNFLTTSFFKIFHFIQSYSTHTDTFSGDPILLKLLVPLGISYITFQAVGYTIEIYRGNHPAEKHFGLFITYLMFFPKLLSGPIERAHHFLPQLREKKVFDYALSSEGLKLIVWGLVKKLVIADTLAKRTELIFQNPDHYAGAPLIFGAMLFSIQLYADFSGYTDIAIGSANVLGFKLMKNFDFPFIAKSTTEFWRRWHISLSSWCFEYIYNPIAIAKRDWDKWAVVYASIVTFVLLGLWHGPHWKFVVFGLFEGTILSVEFLTRKQRKTLGSVLPEAVNNGMGVVITFFLFSFASIFFNAANLSEAITFIKHLFLFTGHDGRISSLSVAFKGRDIVMAIFWVFFLFAVEYGDRNFDLKSFFPRQPLLFRWVIYYAAIILIIMLGVSEQSQFIYFKF